MTIEYTTDTSRFQIATPATVSAIGCGAWRLIALRGETVNFAGARRRFLDLTLHSDAGRHAVILMVELVDETGSVLRFADSWQTAGEAPLSCIGEMVKDELAALKAREGSLPLQFMIRHDRAEIPRGGARERLEPGASPYGTLVAHLQRYRFAAALSGSETTALDLGCGSGYGLAMLPCSAGTGIDLSQEAIVYASGLNKAEHLSYLKGDVCTADLGRSFSLVTAFEVMEHLTDHHPLLETAARHLAPDGKFIISLPNPLYHGSSLNPFHLRDMTHEHFASILEWRFADTAYYHQGRDICSDLAERYQVRPGLDPDAEFWLALCRRPRLIAPSPRVSIVMPLFNNASYTVAALTSIAEHTVNDSTPFEVVLVDNGSQDATAELLGQLGGDVVIRRNATNLGFARACNQGALLARGDYVVFLNNDTEVKPGWLPPFVDELASRPATGVVGARLLYPDDTIQHAGVAIGRDQIPFHIHRGRAADDPLVSERRAYPVVTAACAAVRREEFYRIGMFDEAFVNGHEDIDLCLRYRQAGQEVIYRPDCVVVHHESISEGRMDSRPKNLARTFSKWRYKLIQDDFSHAFPGRERRSAESPLEFAIKIGAPDRSQLHWGDIFFAECLAKSLARLGHNCHIHYLCEWGEDDREMDVVIHLKGLSEYHPKPYNINILWMLNHPLLHTREELERYDAVLVSSLPHARRLAKELAVPVLPFLQATDSEHFRPHPEIAKEFDLIFVGNNTGAGRLEMRKIIADLLPTRHRLAVWGNGWQGKLADGIWQGEFVPWQELPALYARGRIILNDHQPDMKEHGFVNNRTFDALACGAVVISDSVASLRDVMAVRSYTTRKELRRLVESLLTGQTGKNSEALRNRVLEHFTFDHRAAELVKIIETLPRARERRQLLKSIPSPELGKGRPLVSVLMGTYNRRRFLPDAISSLLAQSYDSWELMLVNDGGERVDDIVTRFKDPRIRLIDLPARRGKGFAINTAWSSSHGRYIAHLDDDDIWYPDHLERLMLPLLTIPGLRMAYSDAYDVWLKEDEGGRFREERRELRYFRQVTIADLLAHNHIQGMVVVHDRELFREAGCMDEKLKVLIDWDLWRRMAARTYPYHVSRVTAEHYLRENRSTTGKGQITSLAESDPARYMANRLRVVNKSLPLPADSPLGEPLARTRRRARHDLLIRLGERHEQRGRPGRAEICYRRAARAFPEDNTPHRLLGLLALKRGHFEEAADCFKRCLAVNASHTADFLYAALACLKAGRGAETLALLDIMEKDLELKDDIRNIIAEYRCQALQLVNSRRERKSSPETAVWAAPTM